MPRSEFRTIIAPKPVISRIERYGKERGLPSNSQALAAMTEEIGKQESFLGLLKILVEKLKSLLSEMKGSTSAEYKKLVHGLLELLSLMAEQISNQLGKR